MENRDLAMNPPFNHIDCIRIYVPNLTEGFDYYHTKLGFPLVWKTDKGMGFLLNDGITELVIQNEDKYQETDIKVESVIDTVEVIKNAGGKIIKGPFDIKIGKCAVIEDPWGNAMVILDTTKGTFVTDAEGNIIGQDTPNK